MIQTGALEMRCGPVGHPAIVGAANWFETSVSDRFASISTAL
jgi:hypothetical protein